MAEPQRTESRGAWWRDAKFGMFIHWGLYALPAGTWKGQQVAGLGEWIMRRGRIPTPEYEALARDFNPVRFDAREWVRIAKDAGMRYIVITSKHHDGFAMYDSKCSAYDIVDATPFGRDPLRELAAACREAGLRLGFYYSQAQDWHDPDGVGNDWDHDPAAKDFSRYLERKAKPQVREILTGYGPLVLIWFDTPATIRPEQSAELAAMVHELQPGCLVNSRVGNGYGDYDSEGDNRVPAGLRPGLWETPATINETWGFKSYDHNWKSVPTMLRLLVDIVSKGGNYLLNVGPTAEGVIPAESVERLRAMGQWLATHGQAIYGTEPSPWPAELEWGAVTRAAAGSGAGTERLYLHVFDWPDRGEIDLWGLDGCVPRAAHLLGDPSAPPLAVRASSEGGLRRCTVTLPPSARDLTLPVVALDLEPAGPVGLAVDARPVQAGSGQVALEALLGQAVRGADGAGLRVGRAGVAENWRDPADHLAWTFLLREPGAFDVEIRTVPARRAEPGVAAAPAMAVDVAGQRLEVEAGEPDERRRYPRSPHQSFEIRRCGRVSLAEAGWHTLTLRLRSPLPPDAPAPAIRGVRLVPAAPA